MIERLHRVLNGEMYEELKLRFEPVTKEAVVYTPAQYEFKAIEPLVEDVPEPKKATPVLDMLAANPAVQKAIARSKPAAIEARRQTAIREIERLVGTSLNRYEVMIYREAYRQLVDGEFMRRCASLVNEYHAGDCKLIQLFLNSGLRASYSSKSALLHLATIGGSGSGKNDIIANVTTLLPTENVVMYSSITSKVLYYSMRVPVKGTKQMTTNPLHFLNKIIVVTEIADSKEFSSLKAFAELDEYSSFTHSTTIGQKEADLTVKGPRCLWITSVLEAGDEQVYRRFLHNTIEPDDERKRNSKIAAVTGNLLSQHGIKDDPRARIAQAGFHLLFAAPSRVEQPNEDVALTISELNEVLSTAGYNISQIKQLYALMECRAVSKQFERGYVRIELSDVQEGWWLSGFEIEKEMLLAGQWLRPKEML